LKPTNRFSRPIVVGIIAAVLAACGQVQPLSLTPAELSTDAKQAASTLGSLELRIAGLGGRRVLATVEEIAYLKVTIDYTNSDELVSRTVDAALLVASPADLGRVNFTDLTAGPVTVTVEAFDAANQSIGRESRDAVIVAMQAARVVIPLKLNDTIKDSLNGNLAVDINATDGDEVTRSPEPNRPTESGRPELPDWSPNPTSGSASPTPTPTDTPTTVPTPSVAPTATPSPIFSTPPDHTLVTTRRVPESNTTLYFSMNLTLVYGYIGASWDGTSVPNITSPVAVKPGSDIYITRKEGPSNAYGERFVYYLATFTGADDNLPMQGSRDVSHYYHPENGDVVLALQSGISTVYENAARGIWDFFVVSN
jgi:predicted small lipoprotein YifL